MTSPFRTRLRQLVEYLDPRVCARPQRYIDWILAAGVNSYDDLLALGVRTVPATVIGNRVVTGFDEPALRAALSEAGTG